jgi:photosystem II stability/assembly factor-like uncharacterized protein
MSGVPSAVFTSTDSGRHWVEAIAAGSGSPTARGVARTRNQAEGEIADFTAITPTRFALMTSCSACDPPGFPEGTFGIELSTDGGRHWIETAGSGRPLPDLSPNGDAIAFSSPRHGAILAPSAADPDRLELLETDDGGVTWRASASFSP